MRTALSLLAALALPVAAQDVEPRGGVRSEVRVTRVLLDAHVVDPRGDAIPDLQARDFRVLVDDRPVVVEAADFVPKDRPEVELPPGAAGLSAAGPVPIGATAPYPPGRLLVLFYQTDFARQRVKGQMRMAQHIPQVLDTLGPDDLVAVLSYDSHLKLHQDFTSDRAKIERAVNESILIGQPRNGPADGTFSIAANLDPKVARDVASVDRALAETARALSVYPGGKTLLFFGWGLRVDHTPRETTDLGDALAMLQKARVNVFMLDTSDADFHTLEIELQVGADLLGGLYLKTHQFPGQAISRVTRALEGRYVLTLVVPSAQASPEPTETVRDVSVDLVSRRGRVLSRTFLVTDGASR